MKKRNLFMLVLSLVFAVSLSFGFAACDDDAPTPTAYTVTYAAGGGTGEGPASVNYAAGTTFNVAENTFTREGYTFTAWSDGTNTVAEGALYTMPAKNVTFTAQWNKDALAEYTVTFDLGDYDGDEDAPAAIKAEEGSEITLPEVGVDWEEHNFLGWKEDGAEGDPLEAGDPYTVTADVTLVAQWEEDGGTIQPPPVVVAHTVTFVANGETFDAVDVDDGDTVSAPDPAPTHPSKTFHHWATEDGSVYDFETPVTDDLTLEASFYVYVDFDINGAEGTAPAGVWGNSMFANITIPAADGFSKSGFTFGGWKDAAGTSYSAGASERFTASATLTAVWNNASQTQTYTLSYYSGVYNGNGISGTTPDPEEKAVGAEITLPACPWTRTGYVFSSWKVQKEQETDYWVDVTTGLSVGDTYLMPAYNIRLTAVWTSAPTTTTYTVVYDANGGSGTMANGSVESGKSLTNLPACTFTPPAGQTFVGWSLTSDNSTGRIDGGIPSGTWSQYVKGNTLTIYAIWSGTGTTDPGTGESYSITYGHASNAPDGVTDNFPELTSGISGETVTIPEVTYSIPHYTFNGWNVYKLVGGEWELDRDAFPSRIANGGSFTMPNYAIKLVTNFGKNYVTVKFDKNGGTGEDMSAYTGKTYGASLSITVGSAANYFVCTYTGPDGAEFDYWSTKADGSVKVENGFYLTEANGVTTDDVLILYAIWKGATVTPPPAEEQDIEDFVGKWTTEGDGATHTIIIIAKEGDYGLVGYAVLDGNTFLTIFNEDGTLIASNTDDEDVSNYTFALSNGTFTLTAYKAEEIWEATYNFTSHSDASTAPESNFLGKWTRSATQKVLIAADGVAYYTVQGKIQEVKWLIVGEYLVFSYTASNSYDYYYILKTASAGGLDGFFLAPDGNPAAATFTQNGFYVLTVEGTLTEFVNAGSKPTAIADPTAPSGKKFDGWVLVGTDTPFDFDEAMTADASIEPKFVDDNAATDNILVFTGEWKKPNKTLTKITIDTEKKTVVFTVNGVDGTPIGYTVTNDNLIFWDNDFSGEKLYLYINGDSLEIGDWYYGDSDTIHYATFTREGGSEGGGEDTDSPVESVITFTGSVTLSASFSSVTLTSVTLDFSADITSILYTLSDGTSKTATVSSISDEKGYYIRLGNVTAPSCYVKPNDDHTVVTIYNQDGDEVATFTKA